MRGIQIVCVSTSGVSAESDELVRDLENWFADHQQMCRLMTTSAQNDAIEVSSNVDRLKASVDSGHRLLVRLKNSFQNGRHQAQLHRSSGAIPLSGMNRFEDIRPSSLGSSSPSPSAVPSMALSSQTGTMLNQPANLIVSNSSLNSGDQQRVLPSRTYLKKSGNGA